MNTLIHTCVAAVSESVRIGVEQFDIIQSFGSFRGCFARGGSFRGCFALLLLDALCDLFIRTMQRFLSSILQMTASPRHEG